jgi:hypothetical protein
MRFPILFPLLFLTGCASLGDDLKTAEAACSLSAAMLPYVQCLNAADAAVWRRDSPSDLPAYEAFAAARLSLAQDLDRGAVTPAQFRDASAQVRAKFTRDLAANTRRRQDEMNRQNAQDMVDAMGKMQNPEDMRGDMKGMGGMGM